MGISERREREKEKRRNDIVDAAERVFFSRGVDAATMDDVAAEVELAKATLYLYFNSKEELYMAILLRGGQILRDMFATAIADKPTGLDRVRAIGRAYVEFARAYPDYFYAMMFFQNKGLDAGIGGCAEQCYCVRDETMGIVIEAVASGISDGSIRSDIDPGKAAIILWAQTAGVLQVLAVKGEMIKAVHRFDPDQVIESYFELVEHALRNNQAV